MVRFEEVSKAYGNHYAVKSFTLEVAKGELVVLIGPSGCGKTTTLKMVNRLVEPTSGRIYIGGRDIQELNPTKLRRHIGYVIQQIGLIPHLTVAQNIGLVPFLRGMPRAERNRRVDELLEMVGFDPASYRHRFPRELSGGQQQRVGVLRALAADPDLILMDEPFGALDPITREQLQDELKRLQNSFHKTILFVTHDMDEALKLGDRIVIMREGEILQVGSPEDLIRNPADEFVRDFIGKKRQLRSPDEVLVEEVMVVDPVTGKPGMGAGEAFQRMQRHQVNSLLIVDDLGVLLGIVTLRAVQKGIQEGGRPKVEELMQPARETVGPKETVLAAAHSLAQSPIGLVPVVDEDGHLQGILTNASLISTLVDVLWPGTNEAGNANSNDHSSSQAQEGGENQEWKSVS
ncbi:MAG: betaine/proline/choline family ABC transporter ATP-binding protein [Clostridia bacterium]|nr:betaine/proline/choline family ABC transporter ATP-binding protein [Clostridia bacterium]